MKTWRLTWEPAPGTPSHQLGHQRRHLTFRTWEAALAHARKLKAQGVDGKPRIEKIVPTDSQLVG